MDFLVIIFLLCVAFYFLSVGAIKHSWLLVFVAAIFLITTSVVILDSGVEIVTGYSTSWDSNYSSFANDTVECQGEIFEACAHDVNTTQTGNEIRTYSYSSIGRDYEMGFVTIFALLGIYLSYLSLVEWRSKEGIS